MLKKDTIETSLTLFYDTLQSQKVFFSFTQIMQKIHPLNTSTQSQAKLKVTSL